MFEVIDDVAMSPAELLSGGNVEDWPAEKLAKALRMVSALRAQLDRIEEVALERMQNREQIPGFKLVHGRGRRVWSVDEDTLIKRFRALKLRKKDYVIEKIKSPAQMQKMDLPVDVWEKIQKLIEYQPGKLIVVPEEDKREAVLPSAEDLGFEKAESREIPDFLKI